MNKEFDLKQVIIPEESIYFFNQYERFTNIINVLNKYPHIPNQNIVNDNILNDAIIFLNQLKEPIKSFPKGPLSFVFKVVKKITPAKGVEKEIIFYENILKDFRKGGNYPDLGDRIITCKSFFEKLKQASLAKTFEPSPNNPTLDFYRSILREEDKKNNVYFKL